MPDRYHIVLVATEPILGTVSKDPAVYATYIASKAPNSTDTSDELETVPEKIEEKGWTGFHMLDGQPLIYNYVIKGLFKEAARFCRTIPKSASAALKSYKTYIDGCVFVTPRRIPLILPEGAKIECLERPLRADTAQGPRVALARSDMAPIGTRLEFDVVVLSTITKEMIDEWLTYAQLKGLGQWRSGGWGTVEGATDVLENSIPTIADVVRIIKEGKASVR